QVVVQWHEEELAGLLRVLANHHPAEVVLAEVAQGIQVTGSRRAAALGRPGLRGLQAGCGQCSRLLAALFKGRVCHDFSLAGELPPGTSNLRVRPEALPTQETWLRGAATILSYLPRDSVQDFTDELEVAVEGDLIDTQLGGEIDLTQQRAFGLLRVV